MQSFVAESGLKRLACALVLLGLTLCLQGCEDTSGMAKDGRRNLDGNQYCKEMAITGGKFGLSSTSHGIVTVECDAGLHYRGPTIECVDANEVCQWFKSPGKTECCSCVTSNGFKKVGGETPGRHPSAIDADIEAESKALRDKNHRDLIEDPEVACTNQPESSFKEWSELTDEEKLAAQHLGHNENKWKNYRTAPVDKKTWNELTPTQQEAATTLGWTEAVWDGQDTADVVQKFTLGGASGSFIGAMVVSVSLSMCLAIAVSVRAANQSLARSPPIGDSEPLADNSEESEEEMGLAADVVE
eukprot:gnl/MRDRNA2_/MRDRNA2_33009_c0_seq1.p1 gnl/MRDRNA2_/MRDRNA2_33009_c0~~gnl/MRDRNA2_/MRDRNA2_33009_c0_seq1.p1  ORF type:complete len:301 (-),score=54.77 gnl/MRDRNA2_/MRDRNA2_33009_c0_seq1:321-1223(-)